jgi:hypothetical protein
MANCAADASQRLFPDSAATGSFADSLEVVLQPANSAAAISAPSVANFKGMKPPCFQMFKQRSCDRQCGVWFQGSSHALPHERKNAEFA